MNKRLLGLGIALVSLGGGLSVSQSVSANQQYSAARSRSVRLMWRRSMRQHSYTATTGARYSKHLGLRYSNNDVTPTVVWTTDAHEKLYNKRKGTTPIYYHVKSADGTLSGWIWRGYLKAATTATTPATTKTTTQPTTKPATSTDDQLALKIANSLVGGVKPDAATMAQAKQVASQLVGPTYHFSRSTSITPGFWNGPLTSWLGSSDNDQFSKLLAANNLTYGFGYDKTLSTVVVGSKDDVLNGLAWETWVEDNMFDGSGTDGVTEQNFYVPAKVGVGVKQLANGDYAMFSIVRVPAYYGEIALYDE
ncbi:hypothetical protein [Levilactobacillus wangkuiensis]|uniref:hypothetical protein n=1 Tax=Levilactobacillus wangkuiensis TaxID=2799566 RepID=UPI0019427F67|nr:hypothetical protein [Levilactobacillus wangkuiensis]